MSKNAGAWQGFIRSLVLLALSLVLFFAIVLWNRAPKHEPASVAATPPTVAMPKTPPKPAPSSAVTTSDEPVAMGPGPLTTPKGPAVAAATGGSQPAAPAADGDDSGDQQPVAGGDDPDVQRAVVLIDNGNVAEAQGLLDSVLKRDPTNEAALIEMAMVQLLDLKQPEQAVSYLQRVVEVDPANPMVLGELVSLYEEQGRLDEGLNFLKSVNAKNGNESPDLSYGIGQMLSLAGRDQEAIQHFEKAAQAPDNQGRAYRDLGETYARTGNSEKAIESYNRAIQSQEQEINEKAAQGLPVNFAQERLGMTKLEKAQELLKKGDVDQAQALVDEVSPTLPGDEAVAELQSSIRKRREG